MRRGDADLYATRPNHHTDKTAVKITIKAP
jgi:hypothetical protein